MIKKLVRLIAPITPSHSTKPNYISLVRVLQITTVHTHSLVEGMVIMQGMFFKRCTHLLYCSVLYLLGNVNTWRMSKPDKGSSFRIKNQWNILVIRKILYKISKLSKFNACNLLGYWTNTEAPIHFYKFRPERTVFNIYI